MKVYNYLEFEKWYADQNYNVPEKPEVTEYCQFMEKLVGSSKNRVFIEFYSQQFRPEMITELFEGWKENHDYIKSMVSIAQEFENGLKSIITNEPKGFIEITGMMDFYMPKSLNDFIVFIQDYAGIELQWKVNS